MKRALLSVSVVLLMMLMILPISTMAQSAPQQSTNIVLQPGEELLWVNPKSNLGLNDIAYVVGIKEERTLGTLGSVSLYRAFTVIAKNNLHIAQFWERTAAVFTFDDNTHKCVGIDYGPYTNYGSLKPLIWYKHHIVVTPTTGGYMAILYGCGYFKKLGGTMGNAWSQINVGYYGVTVYTWGWSFS